jgi:hypothetical protein
MTGTGHEDAFSPTRLSARCGFSQGTFVGRRGNGRDAPKTALRRGTLRLPSSTRSGRLSGYGRSRERGLVLMSSSPGGRW